MKLLINKATISLNESYYKTLNKKQLRKQLEILAGKMSDETFSFVCDDIYGKPKEVIKEEVKEPETKEKEPKTKDNEE